MVRAFLARPDRGTYVGHSERLPRHKGDGFWLGEFVMAAKDTKYFFHDPARPNVTLPGRPWMAMRVMRLG